MSSVLLGVQHVAEMANKTGITFGIHEAPSRVGPVARPYLSWIRPPWNHEEAKTQPQSEYAQVA